MKLMKITSITFLIIIALLGCEKSNINTEKNLMEFLN